MKKKISLKKKGIIISVILMLVLNSMSVLASDQPPSNRAITDGTTIWSVTSKTSQGTVYGSWQYGTIVDGGAAGASYVETTSFSFMNVLSGSYSSRKAIESSFGIQIGVTLYKSGSYTISALPGQRIQLRVRPVYQKYKVVETQYTRLDGKNYPTGRTQTSYVNVFQGYFEKSNIRL